MTLNVVFPAKWVDSVALEQTLKRTGDPHAVRGEQIHFRFPVDCKVMVDCAVRLLSLANQLAYCSQSVVLEFDEGVSGTMGYLDRMGFFTHLRQDVQVRPHRPFWSTSSIYAGNNAGLVEIAQISPQQRDKALPTRLSTALINSYTGQKNRQELQGAAWTIFAELIDNIFSHSSTPLDGFAALQVYKGGKGIMVAVSDSGLGMLQTLRPSLKVEQPQLAGLSDTDLIVAMFREGLSRHGVDRGCGLKGAAAKAVKYEATLNVRLPNAQVLLKPGREGYSNNMAYCSEGLPLLWGTHINFTFKLD